MQNNNRLRNVKTRKRSNAKCEISIPMQVSLRTNITGVFCWQAEAATSPFKAIEFPRSSQFRHIKNLILRFFAVPRTELIGEPNRYVKAGSRVAVRCVIRGALEPPSYVIWYFGAEQIFPDNKYGWKMQTEEGDSHSTVSCLHLSHVCVCVSMCHFLGHSCMQIRWQWVN